MSRESQSERLAEWTQLLGCPVQLTPDDLQTLNKASMRPVWRHLQSYILPVHSAQIIRKNLLLSELKKQKILPGKFGNYKVESLQELSALQKTSNVQEEINTVKDKVKTVDEMLQSATCNLLSKTINKKCMEEGLKDVKIKATFLELKLIRLQKDFARLQEIQTANNYLKICQNPVLYSESRQNKSFFANCVAQSRFSSLDVDDGYIEEIIHTSLQFPANTLLDGICLASKNTLKQLNSLSNNLDISAQCSKPGENVEANHKKNLTFSTHLNNLNSLVIQNEIELNNCVKIINVVSIELEQEKGILANLLEKNCDANNFSLKILKTFDEDTNISLEECLNILARHTIMLKKLQTLKDLKDGLEKGCSDFEHLKFLVESLGNKENELYIEVYKKVSDLNALANLVSYSDVDAVKAEKLQSCTELASSFLTNLKQKEEQQQFSEYENVSKREIELFQKVPLIALLRKWEETSLLDSSDIVQDVQNSSMLCLLHRAESKDILISVLEKLCWSQTINFQYNM